MSPNEDNMLRYFKASVNSQTIFLLISNDFKPAMSRRDHSSKSWKVGSMSSSNWCSDSHPVPAEGIAKPESCFWRKTMHHSTPPVDCLNVKHNEVLRYRKNVELLDQKRPVAQSGNYDWLPHYHSMSRASSDIVDHARTMGKFSESTNNRNVNFKFPSDLKFEPTTYASMLKKPLKENLFSTAGSSKAKDVVNEFPKVQLPVHYHYVRLGFPEQGRMCTAPPQIVKSNRKTHKPSQNKMDYLRELLAENNPTAQSNDVKSATLDSPQCKRTLSIVATMHPVNGISRPAVSAKVGCANSHIAFIMGFSPSSDSSDNDESTDEDSLEHESSWDVVDSKLCKKMHESQATEESTTRDETNSCTQQSTDLSNGDADESKKFRFRFELSKSDLDAANMRWQQACAAEKDVKITMNKKVSFASDLDLETVHSTSPECRKSPWEEAARDRFRFQRRIHETSLVLNRILQEDHRKKTYETQISPYI